LSAYCKTAALSVTGAVLRRMGCPTVNMIILAGTKIVPSRSLHMNAHGNKQHLSPSTDSVQLNGNLRLRGRTGKNVGQWEAGVSQLLDFHETIFVTATPVQDT
jgi:hypothetical protein